MEQSHAHSAHASVSLNRTALSATLHCLTGCAIGEVLGLALATAFGWGNLASIVLAIALAFPFGYAFSIGPLVRGDVPLRRAIRIAFAADTLSIITMEIADNGIVLAVPGAMDAGLADLLFWGSLIFSLFVAFWAAFPVNRYLIARGRGHALMHEYH
jgi:hypothetical protein